MNEKLMNLLRPGLRLLVICAASSLILGFVNELTAPGIEENRAGEDRKALEKLVAPGESLGARQTAFPRELSRADLEDKILSRCNPAQAAVVREFYIRSGSDQFAIVPDAAEDLKSRLSAVLDEIGYVPKQAVLAWYRLANGGAVSGLVLELSGTGFGGALKLFAAFTADGTLRDAVLVMSSESPVQRKKAEDPAYMRKFIGTRGMAVPVVKTMLSPADADAVSGASVTFMGVAGALRDGSLWITGVEAAP